MKGRETSSAIPIQWLITGTIIIIIVLITGALITFNYHSSRVSLESDALTFQVNTEYMLIQSIIFIDQGLLLFDNSLNYRLKEPMDTFLQAYAESGEEPKRIDLDALKRSFGEGYELYIINDAGVIEYTTFSPEHLMDFSIYPQFYQRLTDIREGSSFVADRIVKGFTDETERKFVYHPTPDHRYILEISYIDDEIQKIRSNSRLTDAIEKIKLMNPYLTSIRIFNYLGKDIGNSSYIPEEHRSEIISSVWETGVEQSIYDTDGERQVRFFLVDLGINDNPPEMNLIAELSYTTVPIREKLENLLLTHLLIALLMVLFGALLAFIITNRLTKPIHDLVTDTEAIAAGRLDHPIRISRLPELQTLSLSLQHMVMRLKEMMTQLQASEEELLQLNEDLEDRVEERTEELILVLAEQQSMADALRQANKKLQLLSGITRHDIRNRLTVLRGYIYLAKEERDEHTLSLYIREAEQACFAIQDQIEFTGVYENLGVNTPTWEELSVIIGDIGDSLLPIRYDCRDISMYVDQLFERVLYNLYDNTVRYAEGADTITIRGEKQDSDLLIIFEDNGTGVPDDQKEQIFEKGVGNNTGFGLFLAREILAITGISIRETGVYGEGARFEIMVPTGKYRRVT